MKESLYPIDKSVVFRETFNSQVDTERNCGTFGNIYTLIDVSGGLGTNPVIDTTHTTSAFTTLDFDIGDRIKNIKYK